MRFLKWLFGGLNDSNSVKTNRGRIEDKRFHSLVKDGCVSMVDGKIIVDSTLYQDIYWESMRTSLDTANRDYYDQNHQHHWEARQRWLETPNGIAWRKRMEHP